MLKWQQTESQREIQDTVQKRQKINILKWVQEEMEDNSDRGLAVSLFCCKIKKKLLKSYQAKPTIQTFQHVYY
jgi:hypothetical protein